MSTYSNYSREELEDRKNELELDIERVQGQLHGFNSVFPTDVNDRSAAGDSELAQADTTQTAQDLEDLTDALKKDLNEVLESLNSFESGL